MRKFLAVAVLGGALAFSTGAAFASEGTHEYRPSYQPMQTVATESQAGSDHSMVAGGDSGNGPSVYLQLHEENRGN